MVIDIQQHTPNNSDKFLVDTNILVFLFCPIANNRPSKVKKYSKYFSTLISSQSEVYITSQILSEFINVYFRIDFGLYKNRIGYVADYKKDYRQSQDFKKAAKTLKGIISNQVLKTFKRLDDDFNNCNIQNILNELEDIDHNDGYYAELVRNKDINILTDDSDFSIYKDSHKLFSGNPRLIGA